MIYFGTPDAIDSFIWIIPNILSIFIRPYFIRFIHRRKDKLFAEYSLVFLFLICGLSGCILVSLSVIPKQAVNISMMTDSKNNSLYDRVDINGCGILIMLVYFVKIKKKNRDGK